jgi:hypothetical protein
MAKRRLTIGDIYLNSDLKEIVSKREFYTITRTYLMILSKTMINSGAFFKAPFMLGTFGVVKYKGGKKRLLDYPHYQKTGELLYRRMDHDSG